MRLPLVLLLCASIALLSGCGKFFQNPFDFGGDDDDGRPSSTPERVSEPAEQYALAIGGVAPGRDELIIADGNGDARDFTGVSLVCRADDPIVQLRARPGFSSVAAGSGVQMVATDPGVTAIRCEADGVALEEVYEVTIPPQSLVQILVAEAGQQLADEATIDTVDGVEVVSLESESPTANALGAVIRNRITRINSADNPDLFEVDPIDYDADPPASYYDAVIFAEGQFSPVEPDDPSHDVFDDAEDRNFLADDWLVAYDQAVIAAAGIFNGDIRDITTGAFAFMSPTVEEWTVIQSTWVTMLYDLPDGAGFTDADFPGLAPIQILIHPLVWTYASGRPAFVFARMRTSLDPAATNIP